MKNIILKVTTFVFLLLAIGPMVIWFNAREEVPVFLLIALGMLYTIGTIWSVSLVAYMASETENKIYISLTYILLGFGFLFQIADTYFGLVLEYGHIFSNVLDTFRTILAITATVFTTIIVKRVFYARSTWFLFFEVLVYPIGMMTLTPDVKAWEKGDKK